MISPFKTPRSLVFILSFLKEKENRPVATIFRHDSLFFLKGSSFSLLSSHFPTAHFLLFASYFSLYG